MRFSFGAVLSLVLPALLSAFPASGNNPGSAETKLLPAVLFGGQHMAELLAPRRLEKGKRADFILDAIKMPRGSSSALLTVTWLDGDFRNRGFLCFAEPETLKINQTEKPEKHSFHLNIPDRDDLRGIQLNIRISDASGKVLGAINSSPLLIATLPEVRPAVNDFYLGSQGKYLWEEDFVIREEGGTFRWKPLPAAEPPMKQVRYIDYENGNDDNPGTSPDKAWKHHPWDPAASGKAAADASGETYLFKRGVIYRGEIKGTAEKAARKSGGRVYLSSSSSYGNGDSAMIYNSFPVEGKWEETERENVYRIKLNANYPHINLFFRDGEKIRPYVYARHPNVKFAGSDDMRSDWFTFERTERQGAGFAGYSRELKKVPGKSDLAGAFIWTDFDGMMAFPFAKKITAFDREKGMVSAPAGGFQVTANCRFHLAGALDLLDEPGEFYFDREKQLLYVMPHALSDLDKLEYSDRLYSVTLDGMNNFSVSNLTFRFGNHRTYQSAIWLDITHRPAALRMIGCSDFEVANCRFEYVSAGVTVTSGGVNETASNITVRDCDFNYSASSGIRFEEGIFDYVKILRNRVRNNGFLIPMFQAVVLNVGRVAIIAGNIFERCGGIGIDTVWGKDARGELNLDSSPLTRGMIFQNQVKDALLLLNDYGNIEMWKAGPVYIFDNVSLNPGGIWHTSYKRTPPEKNSYGSSRFGFAYYLDGGFKGYVFGNIAAGKNNNLGSLLCNASAFQEIYGFQNSYFNNRIYRFGAAFRRQLPEAGRNVYAGNVIEDISDIVFDFDGWRQSMSAAANSVDYTTNILADNIFSVSPRCFGMLEYKKDKYLTVKDFSAELQKRLFAGSDPGKEYSKPLMRDPSAGDFRLRDGVECRAKVFVPWGLKECVGEWEFRRPAAGGKMIVPDASFNYTGEYMHRTMYMLVPRNNLTLHNFQVSDFINSPTEDIIPSALVFNGVNQYASASHADSKRDMHYKFRTFTKPYDVKYNGSERQTFDMGNNNFLIELVFDGRKGTVLSKNDGKNGYALRITGENRSVALELFCNGRKFTASAVMPEPVDGVERYFHHLIAEVDRQNSEVNFYLDGKKVKTSYSGEFPASGSSLSNQADLLVGRNAAGEDYFAGAIDYLRISRGTLKNAETNIDELYNWEFAGPALKR